jgi:thiol-disulfide isomerase/thioredoxin
MQSFLFRISPITVSFAWIAIFGCPHRIARAGDPITPIEAWTLRVESGDLYRGTVALSKSDEGLRWDCPSFGEPLEFPWKVVQSIERNRGEPTTGSSVDAVNEGLFTVEQHSGVTLSGEILGIDPENVTMQVTGFGKQIVPLSEVRNILRIFSASNTPVQVMQAEDWQQVLPAPKNGRATKWFLKAGEIATDTSGTTISQWAMLPALATLDIDVAWEQPTVNWWLTIGEPRRMELQVRKLQNKNLLNITLLVENSRDADVASVQVPFPRENRIGLRLLCDANKGAYVLMMDEQVLGKIKGNTAERIVGRSKFSFTNTALGVLTLRDLRISDRPFAIPETATELASGLAEVMTQKRGTFVGSIASSEQQREIQVRVANGNTMSIALDEIERIEFSKRSWNPSQGIQQDLVRIDLANGLRFASPNVSSSTSSLVNAGSDGTGSGVLESGAVALEYPGGWLQLPWNAIERISRIRATRSPEPSASEDGRTMRLTTDESVSTGRLDSVAVTKSGTRMLMWRPSTASMAAPIRPDIDGEIEPVRAAMEASEKKNARAPAMAVIRADGAKPELAPSRELRSDEPSLFLVTGDCFPGKVIAASAEELEFESSLFERNRVPANQVRGVRVVDYQGVDAIDRATRTRILTLPRVQRKNPPTHLVVSRDGDMLRGRLISFDRDELRIEVRGAEQTLPMKHVAELIWLEPAPVLAATLSSQSVESPDKSATESPAETEKDAVTKSVQGLYQVLLEQGSRISIAPEKVLDDALVGSHALLGPCNLPWERISRMSLGNSVRADASRSRFGKWKLLHAQDPKFVKEGTSEQNDAPADTAQERLLGKLAPDQELPKLDGTPFRLSDYRGKIVILDFWASWCGPCIQSMPRIHQVSREYTDAGVEAVFVNIEESEDRVRALLERLELVPTVAMDGDGAFSKQYAVQAIPQTVVIDRDGVVLKVFVGSGEDTEQELIRVLNELTRN